MAFRVNKNALLAATKMYSGWQRQAISSDIGECYVDRLMLEPGLSIAYSSYTPNRDLIEESVIEKETNTLSMTFGLEGHSSYQSKQFSGEDFSFEPNYTTVTTFGTGAGERRYDANKKVNQLRILVDGSVFERYSIPFQVNANNKSYPMQHRHAQTSANSDYYIKRLMSLITSNRTERPLEKNILTLNLISEQLSLLQTGSNTAQKQNQQPQNQSISTQDEFKITQAKLFMEQYMNQPLTLAYICQKVAISESKFKLGFKYIYNTTPYQMLLDIRMNKAWELLSTGLQVAQTAYAVGYEHPSNFSAAFTRFYGRSPKSIASLTRQ